MEYIYLSKTLLLLSFELLHYRVGHNLLRAYLNMHHGLQVGGTSIKILV